MYYVMAIAVDGLYYHLAPGDNPMGKDAFILATLRKPIMYDTRQEALEGILTALFPMEDGEPVGIETIRIMEKYHAH